MATEIERKYEVPAGFAIPDLSEIDGIAIVDDAAVLDLDATYYDTVDMRLAGVEVTLRRRTGGHDAGWHLKRPAVGDGVEAGDRSEIVSPLSDELPPALLAEVVASIGPATVRPVIRIRNRRRERAVRDAAGEVLALLAEDDVTSEVLGAERGGRSAWRELEVELVGGDRALLDRIEARLYAAGASASPSASKLARALAAVPAPLVDYVVAQVAVIDTNEPGVRAGDVDAVHDMRVAIRRLRTTLRTFRTLFPRDRTEPLRAELQWFAGLLGAVRDGDVLIEEFSAGAAGSDLITGPASANLRDRLVVDQARNRAELEAAFAGDRYADLHRTLAVLPDLVPRGASRQTLLRQARRALRRADEMLEHATTMRPPGQVIALPSPDAMDRDLAFHEARKAYKRARYAVELVSALAGPAAYRHGHGGKQRRRRGRRPGRSPGEGQGATVLAKRLGALQEVLGAHQDAVTASEIVRGFAARAFLDGENTFSYGLLYARQRTEAEAHLAALPRVRRRAAKQALRRTLEA